MFESQRPGVVAGVVSSGNTTGSIELAAAVAGKKTRVYVEHVSLGAAGRVVVMSSSTPLSPKVYFPDRGTQFLGALYESGVNEAVTLAATLDGAAAGDVPVEASRRLETL